MCTKFHWCLIKNNKVIEVWNFFYKSAFWLVGLDGKIMDLHQQNFSGQYWGVKLTCIPNFSEIGQFLQKLSHFIEFRLVGWLGWLGPSDFKKISRWKADGHNISAYKKSSWYLKAFKSYPIFKVRDNNDDNDDADIIGGWIIVRSVLTPSRTKTCFKALFSPKLCFLSLPTDRYSHLDVYMNLRHTENYRQIWYSSHEKNQSV